MLPFYKSKPKVPWALSRCLGEIKSIFVAGFQLEKEDPTTDFVVYDLEP